MVPRLWMTVLVLLACAQNALAAPTVAITAPADNASYVAPATITLTAAASSSDSTVSEVAFYQGGAFIGSTTTAPYTVDWSGVAAGSYSVTAVATDALAAATTSSPITVTVTVPPPPAQVYYIHSDQLNTPRLITDAANSPVWKWDSDPFGASLPEQDPGSSGNAFVFNPRFPGQYFDKETNLHYNYYRTYDPSTGRYIESDPIGLEGGISTYSYVLGNPLSGVDPLGLFTDAQMPQVPGMGDRYKNSGLGSSVRDYLPPTDDPCVTKYIYDHLGGIPGFLVDLGNVQQYLPGNNPDWKNTDKEAGLVVVEKLSATKGVAKVGNIVAASSEGVIATVARGAAVVGGLGTGVVDAAGALMTPIGTIVMAKAREHCACKK